MIDNKEVIQQLINDGEIDADSVSVETLSKHSEPVKPPVTNEETTPPEGPTPEPIPNPEPAPAATGTNKVGTVSLDGKEYTQEELKAIVTERQKDDEWQKKNTQESQRLAAAQAALETELSALRENAGSDEVLKGTIDKLEAVLKKQIENDEFINSAKLKAQYDEDVKTMTHLKEDVEKRYGVTLPPIGSKEFKQYVDLSMTGNPLDLAVAVLHPDKVGVKPAPQVKPTLDKGGQLPPDSVNVKFDRELQVAAEKSGIPIERLRRWAKKD